jgi:asparagine synthase (glutamine-hydrolysing)
MGFGIPIGDWLKGPLRTWCGDLLNSKDLRNDIGVDWSDIRSIWASGDENVIVNQYRIWNAVILADWLNHQ